MALANGNGKRQLACKIAGDLFTISMPSRMIKITINYLPDSQKAFCPEPGILK